MRLSHVTILVLTCRTFRAGKNLHASSDVRPMHVLEMLYFASLREHKHTFLVSLPVRLVTQAVVMAGGDIHLLSGGHEELGSLLYRTAPPDIAMGGVMQITWRYQVIMNLPVTLCDGWRP
jgi:uncharacterized membrane protein